MLEALREYDGAMEPFWEVLEDSQWDSSAAVGRNCWGDAGSKRKSFSGVPP